MASDNEIEIKIKFPLADGRTLVKGPLTYNADGLASSHWAGFQEEPRFRAAYEAGLATIHSRRPDLQVAWRVYVCCWAADHALKLEGDFIECGVFTGLYSRSVCEYVRFAEQTNRRFWLLDTFKGIDLSLLIPAERALGVPEMNKKYEGDVYPEVVETFSSFENVTIIQGSVPGTLKEVTAEKLAYVSIDMNAVMPELAAASFAWERMVPGAIMLLDDYGWNAHMAQRLAMDKFAAKHGVSILALPTGQGMIMKP